MEMGATATRQRPAARYRTCGLMLGRVRAQEHCVI
jgi:hypothetical protein